MKFKKEITIHDKDGKRFDLVIEMKNYFSICSQTGQGYFNPKGELQERLMDIWHTYHLDGMSSGTESQVKLGRKLLNGKEYGYQEVSELLSTHKSDGSELTITEFNKSNKAIQEYKNELGYFNSFCNKLLKQDKESIITYDIVEGEDKYYRDFIACAGDSIVVKGNKILQSRNSNRSTSYDDIVKIINYMSPVKYDTDIYISALVEEYEGKPFIYGHGWTHVKFPENFEKELFKLIDDLIDEEENYSLRKITIEDLDNEEFIQHADDNCEGEYEKLMAACLKEGVSWTGLENVTTSNGDYWDVEGFDYYIYTDEEANEAHLQYIKDLVDDIGWEGFRGGNNIDVDMDTDGSITISKSINIDSNERGQLAGRDGREHEILVNDTRYYLYRN